MQDRVLYIADGRSDGFVGRALAHGLCAAMSEQIDIRYVSFCKWKRAILRKLGA